MALRLRSALALAVAVLPECTGLPRVLLRLIVDGDDATAWSADQRFTLEARGLRVFLESGRVYVSERGNCRQNGTHTEFIDASVLEALEQLPTEDEDSGATVWRWGPMQHPRHGTFTACWCWTSEALPEPDFPRCAAAVHFDVSGPTRLLWGEDADSDDSTAADTEVVSDSSGAGAFYAQEAFSLAVEFEYLRPQAALSGRLRLLDFEAACGEAPSRPLHSPLLAGGPLSSPQGLLLDEDATGNLSQPQLLWERLVSARGGLFRACWCGGVHVTDTGLLNISLAVNTAPLPEDDEDDEDEDDDESDSSEAESRPLEVVPFACAPGAFVVDLGGFAVAGPMAFELQAETASEPLDNMLINVRFNLSVRGLSLGDGEQRVRIVLEDAPVRCGGPGSSNSSTLLRGPLAEDPDLPGIAGENSSLAERQVWTGLSIASPASFRICWCSGLKSPCQSDDDFVVDLGGFSAIWRDIHLLDAANVMLRVRPGVEFDLVLAGAEVSHDDAIRIVEPGVQCGTPKAMANSPQLRGTLAEDPDLGGARRPRGQRGLVWPQQRLVTGGLRRVCWCQGSRSDCSSPDHFFDVGTFAALQIRHAWPESCARARRAFRFHVAGVGLRPETDRVLLARASDRCGEARSVGLSPGGEVAYDFGAAGLVCAEDPNAGAELGERKMVCGDGVSSLRAISPGLYHICLCAAALTGYDCSDFTHYRISVGETFEIASAAVQSAEDSDSGGRAPVPMVVNGPSVVTAAAYAPASWGPGRVIAAGSSDGAVRLWEVGAVHPGLAGELVGHAARVIALAWEPQGGWLVSADAEGSLRLWSTAAGLGRHGGPPHICPRWRDAWERPRGGVSDETWQDVVLGHITDVLPPNVSGELPRAYKQDLPLADDLQDWERLTLRLAARQCEKACATYREMALHMCDCGPLMECHLSHDCVPRCGLEAHIWPQAHHLRITSAAASPDGRMVATTSMDGTARLWDVVTMADSPVIVLRSHAGSVLSSAFAPLEFVAGAMLLATGGGDSVLFWHTITEVAGSPGTWSTSSEKFAFPLGFGRAIMAVAFSPDGRWFALAGSGLGALWDASSRSKVRDLESSLPKSGVDAGQISAFAAVAFASDSSYVALRGPSEVLLWPLGETADEPQEEWVSFGGDEIRSALLFWEDYGGPSGNRPVHRVLQSANGSVTEIHFTPCNVTVGCAGRLPMLQLEIEVPFFFDAVGGSFVEFSAGSTLADDCRGGARHDDWATPGAARSYFTHFSTGHEASLADCQRVGPKHDLGRASVAACHQECLRTPLCNVINFRQHPANCDLRRCHDATAPQLQARPDVGVWVLVVREEAEEHCAAPHDGYVLFGAPDASGRGGLLYGGCGAGPDLPREGVLIELPERVVPLTRRLRFEVAQSEPSEIVGLRDIRLRLRRTVQGRRVVADVAPSTALAFAPAGRLELVATMGAAGDLALFDLRGFQLPKNRNLQFKLKSSFGFDVSAVGLQEIDRIRVVDASAVLSCGDPHSATNTRSLQGVDAGVRSSGNATYSRWDQMAIIQPGSFRACFCTGRPHTCCDADQDFATEVLGLVAAGADPGHYVVCEATIKGDARSCKIEGFHGVGLQAGDMIMVQDTVTCGMASGHIAGMPKVMVSRPTTLRDSKVDGSNPDMPGGQYFRMEIEQPGHVFDPVKVKVDPGVVGRLCWCGKYDNCDIDQPAHFQRDAGAIVIVRLQEELKTPCMIKGMCRARVFLPKSTPLGVGDQLMVKAGTANKKSRLECEGTPLLGLGPYLDGRSNPLKVDPADNDYGIFDFGVTKGDVGTYILCWCQGSATTCLMPSDFGFHVGSLEITSPKYVWPACTDKEQVFSGWREWETFDDCCCNYAAAGAVGCWNENSVAFAKCSELPDR